MKSPFHEVAAGRTYRPSRSARIRFTILGSLLMLVGAMLLAMAIVDSFASGKISGEGGLIYANIIPSLCGAGLVYIGYLRLRASWRLVLKLTRDEIFLVDLRHTTTLCRHEIAGRVPLNANSNRGTVLVPRDRHLPRIVIKEVYGFELDAACHNWLATIPQLQGNGLKDRRIQRTLTSFEN